MHDQLQHDNVIIIMFACVARLESTLCCSATASIPNGASRPQRVDPDVDNENWVIYNSLLSYQLQFPFILRMCAQV
jgi:hypothetical protein